MGPLEAAALRYLGPVALRGAAAAARHTLGIESERTKQLNRLTRGVDALATGPYHAAMEHLELAAKGDSAASHLADAERSFVQAYGNLKPVAPLQAAWAAAHLALIYVATQRQGEARHWAVRAHERATEALALLNAQMRDKADTRVGRLKLTSDTSAGIVTLGGAAGIGIGAAAAGVTIASGGLALPIVGAALVAVVATSDGIDKFRKRQFRKGSARVAELEAFLADIDGVRKHLG